MKKLVLYLLILVLFSCSEDDVNSKVVDVSNSNVLILNEGNFNFGNGSISLYNSDNNRVNNKVFQSNNNGRPIGDVVQFALQINNEVFIVVNNSSKIEVVNATNYQSTGSIQGFNSPRYIEKIGDSKAYVSDLYEDKIYIINPSTKTILKTIETKGWTEEMAIVDDKMFVCHVDSNQLWVYDVNTDQVISKINTHIQPQYVEVDVSNSVWVSCGGGFSGGKSALYKINSTTLSTELIMEGDSNYVIGEIEFNSSKNELNYLATNGLYVLPINSNSLAQSPKISNTNRLFYGFSINPENDEIYISDAIDYQQSGVVYRYNSAGIELDAFKVGIIPGDILFLK